MVIAMTDYKLCVFLNCCVLMLNNIKVEKLFEIKVHSMKLGVVNVKCIVLVPSGTLQCPSV